MKIAPHLVACIALLAFQGGLEAQTLEEQGTEGLEWGTLPDLPDTPGYGGPYAGTHNDALIVAGGANFPDAPPWEGGKKVWHDRIFVLEKDATKWRTLDVTLPRPLAYAATVSTADGIYVLGGETFGRRDRPAERDGQARRSSGSAS